MFVERFIFPRSLHPTLNHCLSLFLFLHHFSPLCGFINKLSPDMRRKESPREFYVPGSSHFKRSFCKMTSPSTCSMGHLIGCVCVLCLLLPTHSRHRRARGRLLSVAHWGCHHESSWLLTLISSLQAYSRGRGIQGEWRNPSPRDVWICRYFWAGESSDFVAYDSCRQPMRYRLDGTWGL